MAGLGWPRLGYGVGGRTRISAFSGLGTILGTKGSTMLAMAGVDIAEATPVGIMPAMVVAFAEATADTTAGARRLLATMAAGLVVFAEATAGTTAGARRWLATMAGPWEAAFVVAGPRAIRAEDSMEALVVAATEVLAVTAASAAEAAGTAEG